MRWIGVRVAAAIVAAWCATPSNAQVSLSSPGTAYTQNFDALASSGTSSVVPTGWAFAEAGTNANTTYTAGTGSSNAGDTYSFGASASTDRAFGAVASGSLQATIGASFTNNTGNTITSLDIAFTTEQWRRGTTTQDVLAFSYSTTATSLTTGTWTTVTALNAVSVAGCTASTNVATNGNSAACRASVSATIGSLAIPNGATFWIRWADSDSSGSDDGLGVDDFSLTPNASATPTLTVLPGSLTFTAVSGTNPPSQTTTLSPSTGTPSYTSLSDAAWLTASPASGATPQTVTISADTTGLAPGGYTGHVTFSSATYTDAVLTVTFNISAPPTITIIDQITGSGTTSPKAGQSVTTRGVVTAIRSATGSTKGFYIEALPADRDADTNTSEGLLVFVGSSSIPACAVVGNYIQIDGTVSDFVSSTAPVGSVPLTELGSPANCQILATNSLASLPAVVTIDSGNPLVVGGSATQARKWLSMRVSMPNAVVTGASLGNLDEPSAQSTVTGEFFVTLPGVSRPQHGAGIQATRRPSDAAGTVPSWNGSPEVMRINTTALTPIATPYAVAVGATVTGLSGVMDYNTSDGDYQLYTDSTGAGTPSPSSPNLAATPVPAPLTSDLTIGSFNMERFYNDTNEGNGATTLSTAAYQGRLNKASLAIRNVMRMPDIIGLEEVEGKRSTAGATDPHVIDAIVAKVNADAVAAGQGNPNYAWCIGVTNDPSAITPAVIYKQDKVQLTECSQYGVSTTYSEPDGGSNSLNDRPPMTFKGTATAPGSDSGIPVRLVVNHLRSLGSIDQPGAGNGDQVRTKRNEQAKYLANLINGTSGEQATNWNTTDNLVVVGDFNAYQVNDGYVDVMNCIAGNPAAANTQYFTASQLAVDSPCTPILSPALNLLTGLNPASYYSYVFSGSIQTLDHVLLNNSVLPRFRQLVYARNDAEFPEGPTYRNDFTRPERVSDHDMPVLYLRLPVEVTSRTRINATPIVLNRATGRYTSNITVTNTGATSLTGPIYVFFTLDPGLTLPDLPTYNGQPYATISLSSPLAPGATSSSVTLSFANPTNARAGYTTKRFDGSF
jgi:uncharacterized protein